MEPERASTPEEEASDGASRTPGVAPGAAHASDDTALLRLLREGDEGAFESIFRRWYAPLVRLSESLTRSRARAEEIVQDVMLELWRRRATLEADGSPQAYLFQSTRNRSLNDIRHERVKERGEPHVVAATAPFGPAADTLLEEGEIAAAVHEALSELSDRSRTVFEMSRMQGLRYQEIAESLGISIKTVEAHMGKALRHLRERMAQWLPPGRHFAASRPPDDGLPPPGGRPSDR
jgi:RNA polymerase sigma-70 factor, ECF subfamily